MRDFWLIAIPATSLALFYGAVLMVSGKNLLYVMGYVLRRKKISAIDSKDKAGSASVMKHLKAIMDVIVLDASDVPTYVHLFIGLTMGIFVGVFLVLALTASVFVALISAFLFASLPYIFIRLRLYRFRIRASRQTSVVDELVASYKRHNFDMTKAIDETIGQMSQEQKLMKKIFLNMSISLKNADEGEKRQIIEEVIYKVDTKWMRRLCMTIYIGSLRGQNINVLGALESTQEQIAIAHKLEDEAGVENVENKQIIYASIPSYLGSIYMLKMMHYSMSDIVAFQFGSSVGYMTFSLMVFLMIFNAFGLYAMRYRKFDIA